MKFGFLVRTSLLAASLAAFASLEVLRGAQAVPLSAGIWRGSLYILDNYEVPVDFIVSGPRDSLAVVIRIRAASNVEGFRAPRHPARNVRFIGDTLAFEFDGPGPGDDRVARCKLTRAPASAYDGGCSANVRRVVIERRMSR